QAKRHLRKFNGIPKEHFELYLKECEWRFNNSEIKFQISILKQSVKQDLFWLSRTAPKIMLTIEVKMKGKHVNIVRKK
ncbi:hypothetical protein IR141_00570, partial [Neisseria sp. 19428wB4_WF04]